MLSDPVNVRVASGAAVLVSLHGPEEFILTGNGGTALAVAPGDQTMAEQLNTWTPMSGRPIVTGISVLASAATRVVVAMGDSITDGNRSDRGALHSWPEQLSHRLTAKGGPIRYAVVNAGIAGNRLLQPGVVTEMGISALARLDRDVLRIDGLSHIVLLEGTNDIGMSGHTLFGDNPDLTVDDLVIGYRQIIARAHARHVKVIIATILPFGGSISHSSPDKEKLRQLINSWIRASGEPDGVVDFDAVMHDPADPSRMQMQFDSGDHLHPNEAGSRAMGDAIDLSLFR
jgi:lysophospholipase L1-like esterase